MYRSSDRSDRPLHAKCMSKRISLLRVCTTLTLNTSKNAIAEQPRSENSVPRILCMFIRPPANFWQSFAYFRAILCEPFSQKSRFFLVQRNFPLYTRGLLGCLVGIWPSGPKPCGGNNGLGCQSLCQTLFKKDRPIW